MTTKRNLMLAAFGLVLAIGGAGAASADPHWQDGHPARAEVNARLENQSDRIREERHEGDINGRQAHRLRMADRHIRMQEHRFARHHHGHLTAREQWRLNHEENRISHRIGH